MSYLLDYKNWSKLFEDESQSPSKDPLPMLTGGSSQYLQQTPNFDKFAKFDAKIKNEENPNGTWLFSPVLFQKYMIEYLGGEQSGGEGIIAKNIFFFKDTIANYLKQYPSPENFKGFGKNSTDGLIVGSFIPKAWYYGRYYQNPQRTILYLFNREITTNYSGDPSAPFITTDGRKVMQAADVTYTFGDLNVPMAGESQTPYVDDVNYVSQTLIPSSKLKKGVDYVTLEIQGEKDMFCPQFNGYADYLTHLNFGKTKNSFGINGIGITQTKKLVTK